MGGKFKLLSLPCWGSQQPKLQNWNCKEWSRCSHSACAAPGGGQNAVQPSGESVPEGVAGHGGQVQAAELALLGLAAAQAAELELQGMEQVSTFGACTRTGWGLWWEGRGFKGCAGLGAHLVGPLPRSSSHLLRDASAWRVVLHDPAPHVVPSHIRRSCSARALSAAAVSERLLLLRAARCPVPSVLDAGHQRGRVQRGVAEYARRELGAQKGRLGAVYFLYLDRSPGPSGRYSPQ